MNEQFNKLNWLIKRMEKIINDLERSKFDDFLTYRTKPWEIIKSSILIGIARGLGTAIGFSVLGAIFLMLMRELAVSNLPFIAGFIAEIIKVVDANL